MSVNISPDTITAEQIAAHNRHFGYAGDVQAVEAWSLLQQESKAALVDVRTSQEWEQTGIPDLAAVGRQALQVTWQNLPGGVGALHFAEQMAQHGLDKSVPVLLLCRGGARSQAAAIALTAAGYACCLNVAGGFEGENGWRANRLPSRPCGVEA